MRSLLRRSLRTLMPALPMRGRHRLVDTLGTRLAPAGGVEPTDMNGIILHIDHRLSVCRRMYYGVYEMPFVHFMQRALKAGDTFIDLGANIGYITAFAHGCVGPTGKVIACEPSPTCTDRFRTDNPHLPDGVHWVQAAVMDRDGTFPFCDTPRVISHGFGRVLHGAPRPGETVHEVRAVTVDSLLEEHGVEHVHCLKIDVEGCERIVLSGAKDLFARHAVDHVLVETSNTTASEHEETRHIFAFMRDHDMVPYLPDAHGYLHPFVQDLRDDFRLDILWRAKRLGEGR